MDSEQKLPYYIESICKALSINTEQELTQLMTLFDKNNVAGRDDMDFLDNSSDDSHNNSNRFNIDRGVKLDIDPDNILKILKDFYEEKKKKTKEQSKI
jgi:hypothetical protein